MSAPVQELRGWILAMKPGVDDVAVDTNLVEDGVLDSLEMVNFLLFIEDLLGHEIPEALIQPEYFVSLDRICQTFFNGH